MSLAEISTFKIIALLTAMICFCGLGLLSAQAPPLAVVEEPVPPLDAGIEYHLALHATGGAPPYVWSIATGDLPDGIALSADGVLSGRPTKPGTFSFTLKVEDSAHPGHSITKDFHLIVSASMLLEWVEPPKVHDNRIDGTLQVSNGSNDTFDLTVVVVAVAENGRATAIGYEHFPLKAQTTSVKIPFGNTLPHGGYTVRADAIAEIPKRNAILRQGLETPQPLQIVPGP